MADIQNIPLVVRDSGQGRWYAAVQLDTERVELVVEPASRRDLAVARALNSAKRWVKVRNLRDARGGEPYCGLRLPGRGIKPENWFGTLNPRMGLRPLYLFAVRAENLEQARAAVVDYTLSVWPQSVTILYRSLRSKQVRIAGPDPPTHRLPLQGGMHLDKASEEGRGKTAGNNEESARSGLEP